MQCQALSNTHWQTLTVCGQSPLSQNQCSSWHSKGAQCVHCLRCLIHTAACLCSTRTCDGRWERGALCTTARLEMTQRHKEGRLHKQTGRERESLKKTEVKESHVWRQRTQGYRNRHDWKLWSNKTIAGRERREGNEEMIEHMFGIDSQSLAYREWVTDRIRAAKLKERKEGQGKVRNQRREISRYKKIWGCHPGRWREPRVLRAWCGSRERKAGDWVLAIFCPLSRSLHPSRLLCTSSSLARLHNAAWLFFTLQHV